MKRFYTLAIAVIAVIGLALFATPASAVHKGAGGLTCGSCHTMHNSQGTADLNGQGLLNPTLKLLRGASADHNFCLRCHATTGAMGGAGSTHLPHAQEAPKVLSNGTWTAAQGFSLIGAGGDFYSVCGAEVGVDTWPNCFDEQGIETTIALGRGHSLGVASTTVPPGGDAALGVGTLECTSCHDPHGTDSPSNGDKNIFRNLLIDPAAAQTIDPALNMDLNANGGKAGGAEYTSSWKGSTNGTFAIAGVAPYTPVNDAGGIKVWPVSDGTGTAANSNQYTSLAAGNGGVSAFCSSCHDTWHEATALGAGNDDGLGDWTRHPVNKIINSNEVAGDGMYTIAWANYAALGADIKLPAAQGDGYTLAGNMYYADVDNEDKVFCLSCHFAHGGPYYDNLRWDHANTIIAGDQVGNAIADTVGCQQCHLR